MGPLNFDGSFTSLTAESSVKIESGATVEAAGNISIHASSEDKAKEAAQMLLGCYEVSAEPVARPVLIKQILR